MSTARIKAVYGNIAGTDEFKWICKRVDEVRAYVRNKKKGRNIQGKIYKMY